MSATVSRRTSLLTASTDCVIRTAPVRPVALDDRHGGDQEVLAERGAVALALLDVARERLLDLRAIRVRAPT